MRYKDILSQASEHAHLARELGRFLRDRISPCQARSIVQRRRDEREQRFLSMVRQCVYDIPFSPYRTMLEWAQCGFRDLELVVRRRGIESALETVRNSGVYVTFEEFKGRRPLVRSNRHLEITASSFDNPLIHSYFRTGTSGSTGRRTATHLSLDHIRETSPYVLLRLEAHHLEGAPLGLWYPVPPESTSLWNLLTYASLGRVPNKWFSQIDPRRFGPLTVHQGFTRWLRLVGRRYGLRIPRPEFVSFDQAHRIASCIRSLLDRESTCLIRTFPTSAVRIAAAARHSAVNLAGTVFFVVGEPLTPARTRLIESSGARVFATYASAEVGLMGCGCVDRTSPDDMHFLDDSLALVSPADSEDPAQPRDGLCLTSFRRWSPKILLNCWLDDVGTIERRSCGCLFDTLGFKIHLHHVRSRTKLTSEGTTTLAMDVLSLVEEELPQRFGGNSTQYQIVEQERPTGLPSLHIRVDPGVGTVAEADILKAFLETIGTQSPLRASLLREAGTVRVVRKAPLPTRSGKIPPLRTLAHTEAAAAAGPARRRQRKEIKREYGARTSNSHHG